MPRLQVRSDGERRVHYLLRRNYVLAETYVDPSVDILLRCDLARAVPYVVWQPSHHELVERSVAQRGFRYRAQLQGLFDGWPVRGRI